MDKSATIHAKIGPKTKKKVEGTLKKCLIVGRNEKTFPIKVERAKKTHHKSEL